MLARMKKIQGSKTIRLSRDFMCRALYLGICFSVLYLVLTIVRRDPCIDYKKNLDQEIFGIVMGIEHYRGTNLHIESAGKSIEVGMIDEAAKQVAGVGDSIIKHNGTMLATFVKAKSGIRKEARLYYGYRPECE
jgi:hypothetical protein